ncbi:hypothetical protein Srubr_18030 [Streptomyces rubradiris]|uniref:Uncharacterized protein n=1 Tax=Streptomyces rubradiris TaxID=285531 RepID=A0ABQ3R7Y2_STRRR|nr:hypothetical protein Srubr_18030 [Streptomyces rubradiris]
MGRVEFFRAMVSCAWAEVMKFTNFRAAAWWALSEPAYTDRLWPPVGAPALPVEPAGTVAMPRFFLSLKALPL